MGGSLIKTSMKRAKKKIMEHQIVLNNNKHVDYFTDTPSYMHSVLLYEHID